MWRKIMTKCNAYPKARQPVVWQTELNTFHEKNFITYNSVNILLVLEILVFLDILVKAQTS